VWSQEQKLIGWMIILRDITEERQVAQARELITETLVHDLRSPLGAVLAALDFAEKELSQDNFLTDTVGQALQIARKSGKRIWEMVESLMEMSRLQSGTMDLELTPINLPIFITGVLDEFSSQAAEADILLLNQIPDNLPSVMADPSKLARVMANLIDNAIKFTPAQGRIAVTANLHQDEMVAIQVCDNGPGVPVEFRQAIFERFTQVPGQRGRRRGFGLGLAFCKYVVEAHGGHIWVDTSPGGGSAFTFTIPAHRMKTDDSDSVGFGNGL
jgi:signal transduction histidine kinase